MHGDVCGDVRAFLYLVWSPGNIEQADVNLLVVFLPKLDANVLQQPGVMTPAQKPQYSGAVVSVRRSRAAATCTRAAAATCTRPCGIYEDVPSTQMPTHMLAHMLHIACERAAPARHAPLRRLRLDAAARPVVDKHRVLLWLLEPAVSNAVLALVVREGTQLLEIVRHARVAVERVVERQHGGAVNRDGRARLAPATVPKLPVDLLHDCELDFHLRRRHTQLAERELRLDDAVAAELFDHDDAERVAALDLCCHRADVHGADDVVDLVLDGAVLRDHLELRAPESPDALEPVVRLVDIESRD